MAPRSWFKRRRIAPLAAGMLAVWGCSTPEVAPMRVLPEEPPAYTQVPHPQGLDQGDLLAIFTEKGAPDPKANAETCDADYRKLREKTRVREEVEQGVRELIRKDPVGYHWCFYSKLWSLEEGLKQKIYLDERQKLVIDQYTFLTPVARGFMREYNDSRYLRWAVGRYRRLSELVFYRKLELSPQGALELGASAINPFGAYRKQDLVKEPASVLEKYGIVKPDRRPASTESAPIETAPEPQPLDNQLSTDPVAPAQEAAAGADGQAPVAGAFDSGGPGIQGPAPASAGAPALEDAPASLDALSADPAAVPPATAPDAPPADLLPPEAFQIQN